jgi:hypothetical protein
MNGQCRLAAIVSADVAGYSRLTCLFLAHRVILHRRMTSVANEA